jgi:hypothetical protein
MSDRVMKPLLVLTFDVESLVDAVLLELEEAVLPVDAVEAVELVEEEPEEATDAEPGAVPTVPLTVITVAAIGEVNVQSASVARASVNVVCAVVTAAACCVVDASACVSEVFALLTCWESFSFVLANEFFACVSEDCVWVDGAALYAFCAVVTAASVWSTSRSYDASALDTDVFAEEIESDSVACADANAVCAEVTAACAVLVSTVAST